LKEIKSKKVVSIAEVRDILGSLDPEKIDQLQKRTLDYVEKFAKADSKSAQSAINKLVKECKLTEEEAAELVNVSPKTAPELRVFIAGWKKLFPADTMDKIREILKELS
jgi:DNA-directed RNA polymerase subunit F